MHTIGFTFQIVLRFRTLTIVTCTVVEKIRGKFSFNPDHTEVIPIPLQDSPQRPIKEYRLTKVL